MLTVLDLLEPGLHVASEVHHLEGGVDCQQLRLPPQRGGPYHGAVGQVLDGLVLLADEHVVGLLADEVAGQDGAVGQPGGHVLHRVHAQIHLRK